MYKFSDIIGQTPIKAHLTGALSENKISHAYIFAGEEGSGKMMIAERFAAALQCTDTEDRPCGSCISCMQAESHNHPDIIFVTHEKKIISVEDIRSQLVNDISIKPYSGQYKIYIIDDAEKMNEAAQNALLKTLEEPPEYAVILLLTTNTGAFLQTILSRCVTLTIRPIEDALIKDYLMAHFKLPDYVAGLCASFSCGCIGKAIRYAQDDSFNSTREEIVKFLKSISGMSQTSIYDTLSDLSSRSSETGDGHSLLEDCFDIFSIWYRDVLMYKSTGNASRIIFSEDVAAIRSEAQARSYKNINDIITAVNTARQRISSSLSADMTLQIMAQYMRVR